MLVATESTKYTYPTLYGLASTGKVKEWRVWVELSESGMPQIVVEHGYQDGAKQKTAKVIKQGKNRGRSNETSAWQQAVSQAESTWKKKKDSNYRESIPTADDLALLPMLAHKYKDQGHKLSWPLFAQPKLNGVRCLAKKVDDKTVLYTSRKNKQFETFGHIDEELLASVPVGTILDGEIFNPNLTFQEIISRVKRVKGNRDDISNDPVKFYLYDVVNTKMPFYQRLMFLQRYIGERTFGDEKSFLVLTPTVVLEEESQFKPLHESWVAQGFEGSMLRNMMGKYTPDYRSYDLLKHKDFTDAEFVIVGAHEGEGKDEGTVIWECQADNGEVFSARPKGSWERRKDWWDNREAYFGKELTVRYQNLSDEGTPVFPVGLCLRDYE